MRASLQKSIADSPALRQDHYPAGSIVLCNSCAKPLYKLDRPIGIGQKAGRGASAFKPIAMADLVELSERPDVDAGVRATIRSWSFDQRKAHIARLNEPRSGDLMLCPCCTQGFTQVLSTEATETNDKGYVIELVTLPPRGYRGTALRGRLMRDVH